VVAEQADPGWRGTLDGEPLDLVPDDRGMLGTTIGAPGVLQVTHGSWWPIAATGQLVLLVGLLVLSLPKRRTVDPDASPEVDAGPDAGLTPDASPTGPGAGS
jgi:hypothetical protein